MDYSGDSVISFRECHCTLPQDPAAGCGSKNDRLGAQQICQR